MVEKELLLAVAAYNLVRAVMCLAARRANIEPRQLSFSFVQSVVEAALPSLDSASCEEEYEQRLERMLRFAAQGKLLAEPATVRIRVRSGDVAQSSPLEREMPKARERQNESPRPSVGSRPVLASGKRKLSSRNLGPRPEVQPARHHLPLLQRSRRHLRPSA